VSAATAARPQRIRRARARDLANLGALEAAAFDRPWTEAQLAAQLSGGDSAIWLIEEMPYGRSSAPVPLAYALFLRLPGEAELLRVATLPERRGQGLATRLLVRALRVLERSGREQAHLEVARDNAPAFALYERLGFSVSGIRKRYYADGSDAVTMSRGPSGNG
jgi:ribosomal-protein-alanine N-acetyltransferase